MFLIFPRLARISQALLLQASSVGNHQDLVYRIIPMPSPSRKILGSLDRSNTHMKFLEPLREHSGLAQPFVPSRAYRNRSSKVTKGRTPPAFGPTVVIRRLNASNYMALGANTERPSGGFFIINRRQLDAHSGILGCLTSADKTPLSAGCRRL